MLSSTLKIYIKNQLPQWKECRAWGGPTFLLPSRGLFCGARGVATQIKPRVTDPRAGTLNSVTTGSFPGWGGGGMDGKKLKLFLNLLYLKYSSILMQKMTRNNIMFYEFHIENVEHFLFVMIKSVGCPT